MTDTADDLNTKIAKLEDEAKRKDERIRDLRQDLDRERTLVTRMREYLEDSDAVIESWKEAFDMQLGDDGKWTWSPWVEEQNARVVEHNALIRNWNKFVGDYNARVCPRPQGRPLAASEAQQRYVLALRKAGRSLRGIAAATNLSMRTVRTVIERAGGTDRATKERTMKLERIAIDRGKTAADRRQQRTRDAIPKRLADLDKTRAELLREATLSAKR